MKQLPKIKFDWDQGNIDKSFFKHGISNHEAESVFNDLQLLVFLNLTYSEKETRYICYGKSNENRTLTSYFTFRKERIRIIGTRISNKKERSLYENYQS
ncbi:MAG: BrnT family toxin [Chitinophagales bacterium]|nr:BrnT family toxin [Chitinophagales bacterium]